MSHLVSNIGSRSYSISFVIAVNDEKVYQENVLISPVFRFGHHHEILVKRGYSSAGEAYNDAISAASNDLVVFMHQDIYLPDGWDQKLQYEIESLERSGEKWGVLGCFGISLEDVPVGHVYSNGLSRELGFPQPPVKVQSLDEIVLVLRKSSGLRFDPMLSNFHLYGTDICLESKQMGYENYAISNFCIHNSLPVYRLPRKFWQCAEYLRIKWRRELPITTCCITISTSRIIMSMKKTWSFITSYLRPSGELVYTRLSDPSALLYADKRQISTDNVGNMEKNG
ncbi:MAG TPA: glycosyltransferase [Nitrospirota bacterium]|nr:glycosyltransferase [Nitrospirota bacterium]